MSDLFGALAHPVRRKILALLRRRPMTAGELAEAFDLAKPTLSGHFAVLKEAGLMSGTRRGTTITYHLNMSVLEEAAHLVMDLAGVDERKKKETGGWKRSTAR